MARLDKTIQNYQEQLKSKGIKDIPDFVQSILDADITKGKYSRFLLDCYLNDKFREEDLKGGLESTVGEAITLFHKHKAKLPEDMRSVYKYDSPGDLWNAVKQFDGELSGKEIKRSEQDKVYAETEFVYDDVETGFKIVCPLTEEASKWWGKGTRWCTAAEKNNQFKTYAEYDPLLILLMPGGEKLQLWKNGDRIQFMDASDNKIRMDYIEKNWNILEPVCRWFSNIEYIPENYRTDEICRTSIEKNISSLEFVPEKIKTKDFYEFVIGLDGSRLKIIPDIFKTEEICKIAVQNNGYALSYVPGKYITKELYKLSVQKNGRVLEEVPKRYITKELCQLAVTNNGMALQYVPEEYKTKEMYNLAIQQDVRIFQSIPEHFITEELCKLVLSKKGVFLKNIPENYITEEMCEIAVKNNTDAFNYVPKQYRTEGIYKLSLKNNTNVFQDVSNEQLPTKFFKKNKIPKEKYQQVFSEILSFFPEKSMNFKI